MAVWVMIGELNRPVFGFCDNCLVPSHPGKRDPFDCPGLVIRTLDFESLRRIISHDHHHVADRAIHHVLLNNHAVTRCRSLLNCGIKNIKFKKLFICLQYMSVWIRLDPHFDWPILDGQSMIRIVAGSGDLGRKCRIRGCSDE